LTSDADQPVLRVVPGPTDINSNGHIFGGWILSQMDIAGGITARRRAKGPVATVAIEGMEFLRPVLLLDILSLYAKIERIGRTSMRVRVDVKVNRADAAEEISVTGGLFTFVAIDANGRPRPVDPE
jgi:acyl-CoA thioesterase YciA